MIDVDPNMLQPETLRNLLSEFVLREGTDYGFSELSMDEKIARLLKQIESGRAKIVYDPESMQCNIVEG